VSTLYVVATPIGNLGDVTMRAVDILKSVDRIAAEDTRHTKKLLSHLGIEGKPMDAVHAHSSTRDVAKLVERLVAGESIALVSDAGTPVVSDPGDDLVRAAIAAGVRVVPIPGASALLSALVASGLAGGGGFRFVGFVARDGAARRDAIAKVCETPEPVVLYESPRLPLPIAPAFHAGTKFARHQAGRPWKAVGSGTRGGGGRNTSSRA